MKSVWQGRLLHAAAWLNLLMSAVVIAAAVSFGPSWPLDLSSLMSGGLHVR